MSVIDINERPLGRTGKRESSGSSYTRVLIVRTDTINDGPEEVIQMCETAGYTVGSTYPSNAGAYLETLEPDPIGRQVWEVTLEYKTPTGNPPNSDPTDDDPVIRFSFAQYNKVIEGAYDRNWGAGWAGPPYVKGQYGWDVINSALNKFSPEPTQQVAHLLIDITLWRNTFDPEEARSYINTVNDDVITIAGVTLSAWEAYMRNYGGTKKFKSSGADYWEYNWQVEVHEELWVRAFLDQGFYKMVDGLPVLILDTKKQKLKKPALLDGAGSPLPASADPVFLEYLTYYPADWSVMNIPTTK